MNSKIKEYESLLSQCYTFLSKDLDDIDTLAREELLGTVLDNIESEDCKGAIQNLTTNYHDRSCLVEKLEKTMNGLQLTDNGNSNLLKQLLSNPEFLSQDAIAAIPDGLKEQITLTDADKEENDILNLIDQTPEKQIALNNLLFAYQIVTGISPTRIKFNNRLNRMMKKGRLFSVPGKKGVYSSIKIDGTSDEDINEEDF